MSVTGNNSPAHQREQDHEFESVDQRHDGSAQARADEIDPAKEADEQRRDSSEPLKARRQ
jgi:hypothetical protein